VKSNIKKSTKTFKEIIDRILTKNVCHIIDVFDSRGRFFWRCDSFSFSDVPEGEHIFMLWDTDSGFDDIDSRQPCTVTKRGLSVISSGKRVYLRFYALNEISVD
jgi:hypothetical protein